jgi:maltose O-acetyltransferase
MRRAWERSAPPVCARFYAGRMSLEVGEHARIDRRVVMSHTDESPIVIGMRAYFLRGSEILGPVTVGDNVFINRDAYIRPKTTIGDGVRIGPFVRLITDTHEIGPSSRRAGKARFDPIVIGAGTWIGASVTVLAGVTIGRGCVIAAGSIVTKDVPDNVMVGGVPARHIRDLPDD